MLPPATIRKLLGKNAFALLGNFNNIPVLLHCITVVIFLFSRGTDNVIGVHSTQRCDDNMVFVLPYFPHKKFQVNVQQKSTITVTIIWIY